MFLKVWIHAKYIPGLYILYIYTIYYIYCIYIQNIVYIVYIYNIMYILYIIHCTYISLNPRSCFSKFGSMPNILGDGAARVKLNSHKFNCITFHRTHLCKLAKISFFSLYYLLKTDKLKRENKKLMLVGISQLFNHHLQSPPLLIYIIYGIGDKDNDLNSTCFHE